MARYSLPECNRVEVVEVVLACALYVQGDTHVYLFWVDISCEIFLLEEEENFLVNN
jgi:hypothetical protein